MDIHYLAWLDGRGSRPLHEQGRFDEIQAPSAPGHTRYSCRDQAHIGG